MRIGELHPRRGHGIDVRRLDFALGIQALDIAVAEVIGEDEDDVRLRRGRVRVRRRRDEKAEETLEKSPARAPGGRRLISLDDVGPTGVAAGGELAFSRSGGAVIAMTLPRAVLVFR